MPLDRLARLATALVFLSAIPVAAAPATPDTLLVQPARVDLDRDGRADTAAGVASRPAVVRVTLSRSGPRDLVQPARVLAIAGLDYDRDGDIDLIVGTSAGALLWINDGAGAFSLLPVALSAGPPSLSSSSAWTAVPGFFRPFLDRNDQPLANSETGRPRDLGGFHGSAGGRNAVGEIRFSQSRPRAPPRS